MNKKVWQFVPPKPASASKEYKAQVLSLASQFLDSTLKPKSILPPPSSNQLNYIVDLFAKWHGRRLYLCSKYASPGPNAISPFFDSPFARLEYVSHDCFHVSYQRHNGEWVQLHSGLSLSESLASIVRDPLLLP